MKTRKYNLVFKGLIPVLFSILTAGSFGQVLDSSIVKSRILNKEDVLFLESSIGDIDIRTWDKSELKVEYIIYAEARSEKDLSLFRDKFSKSVEDQLKEAGNGKVYASLPFNSITMNNTKVEITFKNDIRKYELRELKVTLSVYMPKVNPLNVRTSFIKLTIENLNANATIKINSTELKMGDCKELDINASFSKNMKIGNVESAKMEINSCDLGMGTIKTDLTLKSSFSHIDIEKIGNEANMVLNSCTLETTDIKFLDIKGSFIRNFKVNNIEKARINLNSSQFEANNINTIEADKITFTTLRINEVNDIQIASSSSSTFSLDRVTSLASTNSSFSAFNINNLKSRFKTSANSGNVQIKNVLTGFEEINIDGRFVTIDVHAAENCNYMISADLVFPDYNFSNIFYKNHEKDMSHEVINGWKGSEQTTTSRINLKCQSCKITLN